MLQKTTSKLTRTTKFVGFFFGKKKKFLEKCQKNFDYQNDHPNFRIYNDFTVYSEIWVFVWVGKIRLDFSKGFFFFASKNPEFFWGPSVSRLRAPRVFWVGLDVLFGNTFGNAFGAS